MSVSRKLVGQARSYVKAIGSSVVPSDCALIMRTEAAGVTKEVRIPFQLLLITFLTVRST